MNLNYTWHREFLLWSTKASTSGQTRRPSYKTSTMLKSVYIKIASLHLHFPIGWSVRSSCFKQTDTLLKYLQQLTKLRLSVHFAKYAVHRFHNFNHTHCVSTNNINCICWLLMGQEAIISISLKTHQK